jgi:hypothetical protein
MCSGVQQIIGISLYSMRARRRRLSSKVRVALLHFTKQLKDIKVDRMIK